MPGGQSGSKNKQKGVIDLKNYRSGLSRRPEFLSDKSGCRVGCGPVSSGLPRYNSKTML